MNKKALQISLGILAFALALCAAYFSITGLSMLFAGASVAVIIMASCLEVAKLVSASFLYQFWNTINKVLRTYLTIAVVVLALITSLGIYGFLTNAYQQTKNEYSLSKTAIDSLSANKSTFEAQLTGLNSKLSFKQKQLENYNAAAVNRENLLSSLSSQNRNTNRTERNAMQLQKDIAVVNKEIDTLLSKISVVQDSIYNYEVLIKKTELTTSSASELGPLEYLSGILNVDMDKIVNWFVLLFVFVFDPLALALVIAFNSLTKESKKENVIEPVIENIVENTVIEPVIQTENVNESPIIIEEPKIVIQKEPEESIYEETKQPIIVKKNPAANLYSGGVR